MSNVILTISRRIVAARDAVLFHPLLISAVDQLIARVGRGFVNNRGCLYDVTSPLVSAWVKSLIFWGFYEKSEVMFIQKYLDHQKDVIELGGSIGVVYSQIAKRLPKGRRLVTVEADPRLIAVLERNIGLNVRGADAFVVHGAVDYGGTSSICLRFGDSNLSGAVAPQGSSSGIDVPTLRLSDLCERFGIARFTLVSDIEGAEAALVRGEQAAL